MSYITEAHNRLLARLAKCAPTDISVNPSVDEMICQRDHIEQVAALVDDYLHSLAIDAAANSHEITPDNFISVVSDAVYGASLVAQFTSAAHEIEQQNQQAEIADHHYKLVREGGA